MMPAVTLIIALATATVFVTLVPGAEVEGGRPHATHEKPGAQEVAAPVPDRHDTPKSALSRIAHTVVEHVQDSWSRAVQMIDHFRRPARESAADECPDDDCARRLPGNIITPYVIEMPLDGA